MGHAMGWIAVVPVAVLLTISFFVLYTRTLVQEAALKMFGLVVAGVLWVAAAVVLGAGLFMVACGGRGCFEKMGRMHGMMHPGMAGCPAMAEGNMGGCPPQAVAPGAPKQPKALAAEEKK